MKKNLKIATKEEQFKEAKRRKKLLIKLYGVDPNNLEIMDEVREDEYYGKKVREFEENYNAYVYHIVLSTFSFGIILNMLFVSSHKEEWQVQGPTDDGDDAVLAYTYNMSMHFSEFGYIFLANKDGKLERVK